MHVIAGFEIRVFSALRDLFTDARWAFRLLLPPPCPPSSAAAGEGLHGGLPEGSCGRRRRRGMPNRQNVGEPPTHETLLSEALATNNCCK